MTNEEENNEEENKAETAYAPEPWRVHAGHISSSTHGYVSIRTPFRPDAFEKSASELRQKADENARRIVACVNACANFDTAALESLVPGSLFQHLKALVDYTRAEEADYYSKREADEEETGSHIWTSIGPLARLVGEPCTEEASSGTEEQL